MAVLSLKLESLSGPAEDWFGGHVLSMQRDPLGFGLKNLEYGDLVKLNFMGKKVYQINNPEMIGTILQNNVWHKSPFYRQNLKDYLGEGLLISDGDYWKRQRRLVQPAFHSRRIESYAEEMVRKLGDMLESWEDLQVRDISGELMRLAFGIVSKTLFGLDLKADDGARAGFSMEDAVSFMLDDIVSRSQSLVRFPAWVPSPQNLKRKQVIRALDELILSIIDARRQSGEDKGDLLSMLLFSKDEEGKQMTDVEVRNEALTLILAGQETTATALTWVFYLLALNPQALSKLEFEVDTVLAGRAPSLADLKSLPYVEQVIKEAMRLYPPSWILSRQAVEETQLGGYQIPAGTGVMMSIWGLHRDERFYPNPESFMPGRWDAAMNLPVPRYAYIPFANGPRVCIGNAFASMEMALLLAGLVQRFRLHRLENHIVELAPVATLRPKTGMLMRLEKR